MKSQILRISKSFHERSSAINDALLLYLEADSAAIDGHAEIESRRRSLEKRLERFGITAHQYFVSVFFIQSVSEFELHLIELMKVVFLKHPEKLGSVTFKLSEVLDASSRDELVERAASSHLNKIMYDRPSEYLKELAKSLSFDVSMLSDLWPAYVESKARRDLGVHGAWLANEIYIRKVLEVGLRDSTPKIGALLIPEFDYFIASSKNRDEIFQKLIFHCVDTFL